MSSQAAFSGRTPLAFLFTNDKAQIVYADSQFRQLMKRNGESIIGVPLHEALGLEQQLTSEFFDEVREVGTVEKRLLELRNMLDEIVHVTATSWASFHDEQGFVGVNVKLREISGTAASDSQAEESANLVSTRMQSILAGAESLTDDVYLRLYATAQIEALQVLLARLLGLSVRDKLEEKINKVAQKNNWPVKMTDGELAVGEELREAEAYRVLLGEAVKYVEYLMGERVVAAELNSVDGQVDEKTLELVGHYGLRDW